MTAALLDLRLVREQFVRLGGNEFGRDHAAVLVGAAFLHDIGKANLGFWRKQRPSPLRGDGPVAGHVREAAPLLFAPAGRVKGLLPDAGGSFLDPSSPAGGVLIAALGHHGEPLACPELDECATRYAPLWQPAEGYDPLAEARALCTALATWLPESLAAACRMPPYRPPLLHAFAGLVSLADWIASNDAPGFFPYNTHGSGDRWSFARARAVEVLRAMCLDPTEPRRALVAGAAAFGDVFDDGAAHPLVPNALQARMADTTLGPIVIAEAATGSGKTEAALWRFRTLMAAGAVDGLAFLLPTRIAAVQIEGRVRRAVARMWPDPATRPNVVLAVPAYARADGEDGARLPGFEVLWPDSADAATAHRRWAAESPKRSLAAGVVVGTVDQALLGALRVRHAHLRGACLLRLLLVVDEVHASDPYMTGLLRTLLARHKAAGGHALLLSATLGAQARGLLLNPEPHARPERCVPKLGAAAILPYPAVSDAAGLHEVGNVAAEKTVMICRKPWLDMPEAIAAEALEAARRGARVLVIRNTVGGVVAVQRALEAAASPGEGMLFRARGVAAPHHGRFAAPDRRLLDAAVEETFGKLARRDDGGRVLVGSQTLEQSLDIDADLLLTDLCPMDVMLQRLGRLHRHERSRPSGFQTAMVFVLVPEHRDLAPFLSGGGRAGMPRHGLGMFEARGRRVALAYANLLSVEATLRLLEARGTLSIPRENRLLVEHATHRDALDGIAAELGEVWEAHRQALAGIVAAQGQQAGTRALRWEDDLLEMRFPSGLDETIGTRLGARDRRLRLAPAAISPFGLRLDEVVVPAWMAGGIGDAVEEAAVTTVEAGFFEFEAGESRFRYGSMGLERDRPG